jgi:hypothetical protein
MFRVLSNGLAAVGLAAVIALVALMSGSVASKPAEAAPGPITLTPSASSSCTTGFTAMVTAPDGTQTSVTFSATPSAAGSFTASSVPLSGGIATTTFTLNSGYSQATVVAMSGTSQSNVVNVSATGCGGSNNCTYYPYSCYNGCNTYPYTGCGTCDPIYGCGSNCYYGNVYSCGGVGSCYGTINCGTNCGLAYYSGCGNNCVGVYYNGCGYSGCGGTIYNGYNTVYGCNGNCGGTLSYLSCVPPTCGNINGPILNCSNSYVPSNNQQYVPGRVSILPSASTIACGGATAITVNVTDPNGFKVPDGTTVNFTTTLGYIQATDQTAGGTAVASLTIPPGTNGNAKVTATAGGQSADTTINVTCAAGAPAVVAQPLPIAPSYPTAPIPFPTGGRPSILPPSTGDAGLLAAN